MRQKVLVATLFVLVLVFTLWGCGLSPGEETVPSDNQMGDNEETREQGDVGMEKEISLVFNQKELYSVEGAVVSDEAWRSTDFVKVDDYEAISYVLAGRKDLYSVTFFDQNKTLIEGTGTVVGRQAHTIGTISGSAMVPDGAMYARFITYQGERDPMEDAVVVGFTSRASYEAAMEAQPLGGLKIACLGDSLTEGDYGLQVGVANVFYRNYPFYLAKMTGASTVNYGYCGITSTRFLEEYRAGNVDVKDADVVIVMLGTNAGLGGEHGANYETLISELLRDMKKDAVLILAAPPHATEDPAKANYGYNGNVISAVDFVRKFAAEQGLPLIDAYADSPIQPEYEDRYQTHDGLHMSRAGYEAFAAFMAEKIAEIVGHE